MDTLRKYWVYKHNLLDRPTVGMDGLLSSSITPAYLAADVEAVEADLKDTKLCLKWAEEKRDSLRKALAAKDAEVVRLNEVYENCKGLLLALGSVKLSPEMCEKVGQFNLMLLAIHKEREQRGETN